MVTGQGDVIPQMIDNPFVDMLMLVAGVWLLIVARRRNLAAPTALMVMFIVFFLGNLVGTFSPILSFFSFHGAFTTLWMLACFGLLYWSVRKTTGLNSKPAIVFFLLVGAVIVLGIVMVAVGLIMLNLQG